MERGPDWQEIVRKTERFSLAPLVHASLRDAAQSGSVPAPVAERLKHVYRREAIRGMAVREALQAILLRLQAAGIPVVVLKGAALAALVYTSPNLRTMGDIDLLVHRGDLDEVDKLLHSMTYVRTSLAGSVSPHSAHAKAPSSQSKYVTRIIKPTRDADEQGPCVDLPVQDFWRRSRAAEISSVATLVVSHEDLLVHLAIQFGMHLSKRDAFGGYVRALCDIREICTRYGPEINWSDLVIQAAGYGVGKHLYYSLCLARDMVGADVPPAALTDLKASFGQLPFEEAG